jgi:hypothetical protein
MKYPFLVLFTLFALSLYSQNKTCASIFVQQNQNIGIVGGIGIDYWKGKSRFNFKLGTQNYIPKQETLFIPEQSDFTRQDSLPILWGEQKNKMPLFFSLGFSKSIFKLNQRIWSDLGIDIASYQKQSSITKALIGITVDDGVMPADAKLAADYCFKTIENTNIQNISVVVPFSLNIMISKRTHLQLFTGFGYQRNYKTKEFTRLMDGYMYLYTDMPGYSEITKESNNSVGNIYRYGIKMSLKL